MVNVIPYDHEITEYIEYVFHYFNHKINMTNPAILTIDWAGKWCHQQYIAAYTMLPNRVFFNPMVIARFCPGDAYLKFQIVETMIHELFHTDQIIQYKRMNNEYYKHDIESAVEKQTATYIKNNLDNLIRDLGFYFDDGCMNYLNALIESNKYYFHPYERRTPADHLWMIVDQFTGEDFNSEEMRSMIKLAVEEKYPIWIVYNGREILIRMQYQSPRDMINNLNMEFYDEYDGYIHKATTNVAIYDDPDSLVITIDSSLYKQMVMYVPGKEYRF